MTEVQMETKVVEYRNRRAMNQGIKKMEKQGWTVTNVQAVEQGYGCLKTVILGCLFMPLALLGRKPEKYLVTYQRKKD